MAAARSTAPTVSARLFSGFYEIFVSERSSFIRKPFAEADGGALRALENPHLCPAAHPPAPVNAE
jgi:hypothetical protein